jgi:hypothetical protein
MALQRSLKPPLKVYRAIGNEQVVMKGDLDSRSRKDRP